MTNVANDGQGGALDPNDNARQPDGTQPPAAPAAAGEGQPAAAPIDPDDAELAAAQAALAAEEAAKGEGGQQPGQPPAAAAGTDAQQDSIPAAAAPTEGQPSKPAPMVPHAVFHKERQGRQNAERERDYLAGKVEALESIAKGTAPATTPAAPTAAAPTPADPVQAEIDAKQAEIFAAAERFDTGEITMAEFKRTEAAAQARVNELQARRVIAASMPQQGPSLADTAIISAHLTTLSQSHPYADFLTPQQAQWLAQREMDAAAALGQPFGTGPEADMRLREAVAKASDEWGPKFGITLPPEVVARRAAAAAAQQPKPGQTALSPDAQARARKMEFAAGLPPDTAQMGAGSASHDLSDAAIVAMDEEAIAAMPAAARARIMNMTG